MSNVDTDAIIPKQFLKSVERVGFGQFLFDAWRYLDQGKLGMDCTKRPLNPKFVLNQERYSGATILLARENFGCGSSREHAPWALAEYGFRAILAPSFSDIFYNNSFKNGMLLIALPQKTIDKMMLDAENGENARLSVDLETQQITRPDGEIIDFEVDAFKKHCLLNGLDDIELTMKKEDKINAFEDSAKVSQPWL